jgi:hypothetical protein
MWSHITNAQYGVGELQPLSDYAETRRHHSDWMYATRDDAGGAHAAQADAMTAYQYQDVLRRTRVPADVEVGCYKMEEYKKYERRKWGSGVAAHGSSSDTYSLYACQSFPDT